MWKILNHDERCPIYREGDKTKLSFIQQLNWICSKQPSHFAQQGLAMKAMDKDSRKKCERHSTLQEAPYKSENASYVGRSSKYDFDKTLPTPH